MGKCVTVAIAGLGNRGRDVYAHAARLYPDKMKITAIADINLEKVALTAKEYEIPSECCFTSAEDMLSQEKQADVMIIATQDRQHVGHAIAALKKGYHLLLEKPISPDVEECRKLLQVANQCNRKVVVCHVLRYAPIYQKVKEMLDGGEIGDIVSIMAVENVGWFHMAHSFVRGNWSNSDETSPMILQKCCHDMDLYLWLAGKKCKSLSSYGSTYLFREEHAPEGCTKRCLDGCKVKEQCPFDAEAIYMENKLIGFHKGNREWPLEVLVTDEPQEENLYEALRTGRYGRCVYHCNNNVVDHQVVNLNMTDGSTMSFTMNGFSADISRYARFMGTKGELIVNMDVHEPEKCEITLRRFHPEITEINIDIRSLSEDFSGHGGGDVKMVEEFLDAISGEKAESPYVTSLEQSMESHYCAFAAEKSRIHEGEVVELDTFVTNDTGFLIR
ncbi:MAG: Gfo/Idh/MocA family oxidoreductase [Hespellia sp.]|nr:Gfo/Idh/MocA family oxidoreductase [Hespellia sp.]